MHIQNNKDKKENNTPILFPQFGQNDLL